jgi:UDP:flavonoid glycosyltransferase YjiC (YdhE family)
MVCGWPRWLKKPLFDLIYRRIVDRVYAPWLNPLRAEVGLPPLVPDFFRRWRDSPTLILGLFPAWFGPPQPDWPRQVVLTEFPLYDERDATPLPAGLDAFLAAGPTPIAFTPGSANIHGRPFFEAAVDACRRLGRRGLLLTRHAEQVPTDLPEGVVHVPFAPFSLLLPRVAALVHHGGIGTCAQGMAAGVPQLVMPLAHDQFDNADRLRRLGVARSLLPRLFRGPAVAAALRPLIESPDVAARCRDLAARFPADGRGLDIACDAIESLGRPEPVAASS